MAEVYWVDPDTDLFDRDGFRRPEDLHLRPTGRVVTLAELEHLETEIVSGQLCSTEGVPVESVILLRARHAGGTLKNRDGMMMTARLNESWRSVGVFSLQRVHLLKRVLATLTRRL